MSCSLSAEQIQKTTDFHGHWCPGLAVGIRAAEWALKEMGKAGDEEIVAVVETDMCGVDAIQYLTGCTFGKGNLIYQDLGKNAFTFYRRRDGKAARILARTQPESEEGRLLSHLHVKMRKEGLSDEEAATLRDLRAKKSKYIMDAALDELFEVKEPAAPAPKKAFILPTLVCDVCNEPVMESRTRRFQEQTMCIQCFEKHEKR
jgi:formylmethanofuran dehydrogenase subunit E